MLCDLPKVTVPLVPPSRRADAIQAVCLQTAGQGPEALYSFLTSKLPYKGYVEPRGTQTHLWKVLKATGMSPQ